jgi:hypothetical protein
MTRQLKRIFKGLGSVMDIAPPASYNHLVPKISLDKRMRGHWDRTGRHLQRAIDRFTNEQEEKD